MGAAQSAMGKTSPSYWDANSPPLLLHFDVNKTLILTDSIDSKTQEEGIREATTELFWGRVTDGLEGPQWAWLGDDQSVQLQPPVVAKDAADIMTYHDFCKKVTKDKKELKAMSRSFRLAGDEATKDRMEHLVNAVLHQMMLPEDLQSSRAIEDVGLRGSTIMMLPAVFVLTARLARSRRPFAIMFRSFGKDHEKIRKEWNAFCEMKHPLFSSLIDGLGPFDGTVPGVPDRRLHGIHTLYRDEAGPVLALDTFTNGPEDATWDAWAKAKPKAKADTRGGREYLLETLKAKTISGTLNLHEWFNDHLANQRTGGIKDDWAWWTWHGESSNAGKLLICGSDYQNPQGPRQLFFDDNVELAEPRIVDCRTAAGEAVSKEYSLRHLITKVSPAEAVCDDEYFLRALEKCHGDSLPLRERHSIFDDQMSVMHITKDRASRHEDRLCRCACIR